MVVFGLHGLLPGLVDRAVGVFRRGVNRVDFQRFVTRVDDVVPFSGRDQDRIVVRDLAHEVEVVLAVAHHHACRALLHAQELVDVVVLFQPHVAAGGNRHQRHLQVVAGPQCGPEILVRERVAFDVQHRRFGSVIFQRDGFGGGFCLRGRSLPAARCGGECEAQRAGRQEVISFPKPFMHQVRSLS